LVVIHAAPVHRKTGGRRTNLPAKGAACAHDQKIVTQITEYRPGKWNDRNESFVASFAKGIVYLNERLLVQLDPTAFLADPELIRALSNRAAPIDCNTDRVLFHQEDTAAGLYIIHEGEVNLSMTSLRGRPIVSAKAGAGSLLGLPGLISNQPYSLTAVARAGSQVSFVDRNHFTTLMQSDPTLAFKILQVLAAEVRSARHALY
jgi:CRP-like cAMP-binding protein